MPPESNLALLDPSEVLLLADTCLLWGHRLSEWCGHGPALEEDIALTNTALDLIGQARALLQWVAAHREDGSSEDTLAYFREPHQFANVHMAALDNGDYAHTIARSFLLAAWYVPVWECLADGRDASLAQIATNAAKESRMQLRHAADWVIRFGDGTDESRLRLSSALAALWPYCTELLATTIGATDQRLRNERWLHTVADALNAATLGALPAELSSATQQPLAAEWAAQGVACRAALLAEMQSLARQHPGAHW